LKFYIEQGAALDILALPAFIARCRDVKTYLEVGCGFGFGLDFARRAFGWKVLGIDPSPNAREGSRLLNLPIENIYLSRDHYADEEKSTVVAALEVVEHVNRPKEFLAVLKSLLAPDGLLILTTPDAGYIEFAKDKPGLLNILAPGYHAVLFTAKSLEIALRELGFADVQVRVRGATLLAICGTGSSAIDIEAAFEPNIFELYLRGRLTDVEPGSMLAIGFGYRLLKHLVNRGLYVEAQPVLERLVYEIRGRDLIDILDPHAVLARRAHAQTFESFMAELPACIVGLFYFTAMLRLNQFEDRSGAVTLFYAAHVMAGVFRRAMLDFGIDDGETADLELRAREHIRLVLGWMTD